MRIVNELTKRGLTVSPTGLRRVWLTPRPGDNEQVAQGAGGQARSARPPTGRGAIAQRGELGKPAVVLPASPPGQSPPDALGTMIARGTVLKNFDRPQPAQFLRVVDLIALSKCCIDCWQSRPLIWAVGCGAPMLCLIRSCG